MESIPSAQEQKETLPIYELEHSPVGNPIYFSEFDSTYLPGEIRKEVEDHTRYVRDESVTSATQIYIPFETSGFVGSSVIFDKEGNPLFYTFSTEIDDIVKIQEAKKETDKKSKTDSLTNLDNRNGWNDKLEELSEYIQRSETDEYVTFAMFDLNNLKITNTKLGHPAGDQLIQDMGVMLKEAFREGDEISRWGGDEFAVFLKSKKDLSKEIQKRLSKNWNTHLRFCAGITSVRTQELREVLLGVPNEERASRILEELKKKISKADELLFEAKGQAESQLEFGLKPTVVVSGN